MNIQTIIIIVAVMAVIALIGSRVNRPRITTIEHRREKSDQPEDGDDA
ncbi:MAG: hypothetical protein ABIW03_01785 [Sphingomicrobium sp.]